MTITELENLMRQMEAEINRLRAINGDLLAALKNILSVATFGRITTESLGYLTAARKAIASAKEQS